MKKYKTKFGIAFLKYDSSGENNLTECMPHQISGCVQFDGNQRLKYFPRRNHPRLVHRATASIYLGTNTDMQMLLMPLICEYLIKCMG